jgi:hypothetical protein
MSFLKGKKTYILAVLGAGVVGAYFLGFLDMTTANMLLGLLGFGGLAALRSGMN